MAIIDIKIDINDFIRLTALPKALDQALAQASAQLAAVTHAKCLELAGSKLNSRRKMFVESLSLKQVNQNTWHINLDGRARWIEDGMPEHSMIEDLLRSPKAKTSKDGTKYLAVPFKINKRPSMATLAEQDLISTVKSFLRNRNRRNPEDKINYGGVEKNADGSPKLGLLHSFDIKSGYPKTHEGPGQGHGLIGETKMGPTGIPFLQGIRIYQREVENKKGKKVIERNVMTFRTVTSKSTGWIHPGLEPAHIMNEAAEWAFSEWDKIKTEVVNNYLK